MPVCRDGLLAESGGALDLRPHGLVSTRHCGSQQRFLECGVYRVWVLRNVQGLGSFCSELRMQVRL